MTTSESTYWICSLVAAYLGALIFLALAGKEWSCREAWLQIDGERRAKKAKLEAEIQHNRTILEEISRAGPAAGQPRKNIPTIAPDQPPTAEQAARSTA